MYFIDNSKYSYNLGHELDSVLNIGWLSLNSSYNKGKLSIGFKSKLLDIIYLNECNVTRGIHSCEFCKEKGFLYANKNDTKILLGHGEIWIPSVHDKGIIYASPTLIYHYIDKHMYLPPNSYIESVLAFDLPKP